MAIGPKLETKLAKRFEPDSRIDAQFGKYAITFITNSDGDPVTLFIGDRNPDGTIKGERYSRKIITDPATGKMIKSHWDLKGKTARG